MAATTKTRGERNNNPGNLRFNAKIKWRGQIEPDPDGYCRFDTPVNGIRAMTIDILTKYRRGLNTVRKIITVYAPPEDRNNTAAYIARVAKELAVGPDEILRLDGMNQLLVMVRAQIRVECNGVPYDGDTVSAGVKAGLDFKP